MSEITSTEPFWRAPKRLRRLLEDGELTATELGILVYLAFSGADREPGFATTRTHLEAVLDISTSTIKRGLRKLRQLELIEVDVVAGQRHPFRVRLTGASVTTSVTARVTHDPGADPGRDLGDLDHELSGEEPEASIASGEDLGHDLGHSRARGDRDREEKEILAAAASPPRDRERGGGEDLSSLLTLLPAAPHDGPEIAELEDAFEEFPEGVEGIIRKVARLHGVDSPFGLVLSKVRKGEHRHVRRELPATSVQHSPPPSEPKPAPVVLDFCLSCDVQLPTPELVNGFCAECAASKQEAQRGP